MKFQILCTTMHQIDFSKLEQMNIHSDVIFANQADRTDDQVLAFDGHTARMITTDTRGVGKNRNIGLLYADSDICLFADDDVTYVDDMEPMVMHEFEAHPDADIFIFHLEPDDPNQPQEKYKRTKKCSRFGRMPWGACRIAFRLDAVRKANLWFTTLFGGGCIFPSGEDSMWLQDARKAGLVMYVSDKTIGTVSFDSSTWFTGYDERYCFAKGVYCQAVHPKTKYIWLLYYALRMQGLCELPWSERIKWMKLGTQGYLQMKGYDCFC